MINFNKVVSQNIIYKNDFAPITIGRLPKWNSKSVAVDCTIAHVESGFGVRAKQQMMPMLFDVSGLYKTLFICKLKIK